MRDAAPVFCTPRKHVWRGGHSCDCAALTIFPTADGKSQVITLVGISVTVPHTDEAPVAPRGNDAIGI